MNPNDMPVPNLSQPPQGVTQAVPNPPSDETETAVDQRWADTAKKAISSHAQDPFTQSQEIAKIKAQYIKERFGWEMKTVI